MRRRRPPLWSPLAPEDRRLLVLLLGLCTLLYLPSLVAILVGTFPFDDDAIALAWPARDWCRQQLLSGHFPIWDPHLFTGQPTIALMSSFLLYPPGLLLIPLPPPWAALVSAWGHHMFLMVGVYLLARAWGLKPSSSALCAILLGLSGAVAARLFVGHDTWHACRAYLPWQLLLTLKFLRTGERKFAIGLGLLFCMQYLAGYPPLVLLSAGTCLYLVIGRTALRWRSGQTPLLPRGWALPLVLIPLMAGTLGCVCLLPSQEITAQSVHGVALSFAEATSLSATGNTFVRLLLPDFFGGYGAQWSIVLSPHEEAAYIGLPALILALLAPCFGRENPGGSRGIGWIWGALPLAALLALGHNTPLYALVWPHLGPFKGLRVPARWMEMWAFAAPFAAAYSFERLTSKSRPARWLLPLFGAVAALGALVAGLAALAPADGLFWTVTAQWNRTWFMAHATAADIVDLASKYRMLAILSALCGAVFCALFASTLSRWNNALDDKGRTAAIRMLALLMVVDVGVAYVKAMHFAPPDQVKKDIHWPAGLLAHYAPGTRWAAVAPLEVLNQAEPAGIDIFNGYNPLSTLSYLDFARANDPDTNPSEPFIVHKISPVLAVAGVTNVLSLGLDPKPSGAVTLTRLEKEGKWTLWGVKYGNGVNAWPRAYLAGYTESCARTSADKILGLQRLDGARVTPWRRRLPALVTWPDEGNFGNVNGRHHYYNGPPLEAGVSLLRDETGLKVWSGRTPDATLLVFGEANNPAWKGYLDGHPVPVVSANVLFKAVKVPAGNHQVTLVFDSNTFRFGLFVTLCSLGCATAFLSAWSASRGTSKADTL